jgi:hypothetical protein
MREIPVTLAATTLATAFMVLAPMPSANAASTNGSCIGQFFSSHAGLAAEHTEPRNVGEFISATAQELGAEFGGSISASHNLPRNDCGL